MLGRAGVLMAAVVMVIGLSACAAGESNSRSQLDDALSASVAAAATSELSLRQYADGASTTAVTDTALEDMLGELGDAKTQVETLDVESETENSERFEVGSAIQDALTIVINARVLVNSGGPVDEAARLAVALSGEGQRLEELRTRVGAGE